MVLTLLSLIVILYDLFNLSSFCVAGFCAYMCSCVPKRVLHSLCIGILRWFAPFEHWRL